MHYARVFALALLGVFVGVAATPAPTAAPTSAPTQAGGGPQTAVDLGAAANFTVFATSTITCTGNAVITGDMGLTPGSSITGFPGSCTQSAGVKHVDDHAAQLALDYLIAAYADASTCAGTDKSASNALGGQTITPGCWTFSAGYSIGDGQTVTLNGGGDPNSVFIFRGASTFTMGSGSSVILTNGAQACNVFWAVGSSATFTSTDTFEGVMLAQVSISVSSGITGHMRLLGGIAGSGAVSFTGGTVVPPPPCSSTLSPTGTPTATPTGIPTAAPTTLAPTAGPTILGARTCRSGGYSPTPGVPTCTNTLCASLGQVCDQNVGLCTANDTCTTSPNSGCTRLSEVCIDSDSEMNNTCGFACSTNANCVYGTCTVGHGARCNFGSSMCNYDLSLCTPCGIDSPTSAPSSTPTAPPTQGPTANPTIFGAGSCHSGGRLECGDISPCCDASVCASMGQVCDLAGNTCTTNTTCKLSPDAGCAEPGEVCVSGPICLRNCTLNSDCDFGTCTANNGGAACSFGSCIYDLSLCRPCPTASPTNVPTTGPTVTHAPTTLSPTTLGPTPGPTASPVFTLATNANSMDAASKGVLYGFGAAVVALVVLAMAYAARKSDTSIHAAGRPYTPVRPTSST